MNIQKPTLSHSRINKLGEKREGWCHSWKLTPLPLVRGADLSFTYFSPEVLRSDRDTLRPPTYEKVTLRRRTLPRLELKYRTFNKGDGFVNRAPHPGRAKNFKPSKMNRSFNNKSQPLRNLSMNAVEVKSKVSLWQPPNVHFGVVIWCFTIFVVWGKCGWLTLVSPCQVFPMKT